MAIRSRTREQLSHRPGRARRDSWEPSEISCVPARGRSPPTTIPLAQRIWSRGIISLMAGLISVNMRVYHVFGIGPRSERERCSLVAAEEEAGVAVAAAAGAAPCRWVLAVEEGAECPGEHRAKIQPDAGREYYQYIESLQPGGISGRDHLASVLGPDLSEYGFRGRWSGQGGRGDGE